MASVLNRYFEWRIERKLAHSSLDALLEAMSDRRYFFPHNVLRPFYNSLYESKKSIGWFATRCAERLKDAGLVGKLKTIVENAELTDKRRDRACFCLGHLANNLADQSIFHYLMHRLPMENDDIKRSILVTQANSRKPVGYDVRAIIHLLQQGNPEIRSSAAMALNNCEYPGVEQVLLDAFLSDKDEHVKNMVVASLRTVGTSGSLTVLKEKLKNTREAKARYYLESAIEAIEERGQT